MNSKSATELATGDKFRREGREWVVSREYDEMQSEDNKIMVHVHENGNQEVDTAFRFNKDESVEILED